MATLFPLPGFPTSAKQCALIPSGDYPPSLRSPWRAADEVEALDIDQPFMFSSHPKLQDRIATFEALAKAQRQTQGLQNAKPFLQYTEDLREITLTRYLDMNNYKVLLLILNNEQLRRRYTDHPEYFLGEAYRLRDDEGDQALAVDAFTRSIADVPDFAPPYRSMGVLLMKQGKHEDASAAFNKYLALAPDASDRAYVLNYLKRLQP